MFKTINYGVSTLEMLLCGQIISDHFVDHIEHFSEIVEKWTPDYATNLSSRIDNALNNLIGSDHQQELRMVSAQYQETSSAAKKEVSRFKKLIGVFLPKEAKEIEKRLGYTKYWKAGKTMSQSDFLGLLVSINKEMSSSIRTKLLGAGLKETVIESLLT